MENLAYSDIDQLTPLEKLELAELRASLRECLNLLPDEKRQLLQFRFWREMTIKEIAVIFDTTERAVEGKIYRTKKALKAILQSRHPEVCANFT